MFANFALRSARRASSFWMSAFRRAKFASNSALSAGSFCLRTSRIFWEITITLSGLYQTCSFSLRCLGAMSKALITTRLLFRGGGHELVHPAVVAAAVLDDEIGVGDLSRIIHVRFILVGIDVGIGDDAQHVGMDAGDLLDEVAVGVLGRHDVDGFAARVRRPEEKPV